MTNYCLENGIDDSDSAIIHALDCSSYDLGSLLGAGRLVNLGDFANSLAALDAARAARPDAIRCIDCCHADVVLALPLRKGLPKEFIAAQA